VIDPWGRIVAASDPGVASIVSARVATRQDTTPYVRHGDWFAAACLLGAAVLALGQVLPVRHRSSASMPAPTSS